MAKYNKEIVNKIVQLIETDTYTVSEICNAVSITKDTFYQWIKRKPDFSDKIKKARGQFDQLIVKEAKKSLRRLINGYEYEETTTEYVDKDGKPVIKAQKKVKKHVAPNVAATIFTLTNKASDEYKNRQDNGFLGKDGQPVDPPKQVMIIGGKEIEF